jgi:hypothetical protein
MEHDLVADPALDEPIGVNKVAVQLETGVVEHKVDSTVLDLHDEIDQLVEVVADNVLFGRSEGLLTGRLKLLDVVLAHLGEAERRGTASAKPRKTPARV